MKAIETLERWEAELSEEEAKLARDIVYSLQLYNRYSGGPF